MNKRTSRKHKNNHVKRSNKSHRRTISKRKKQSGGGDIRSIILGILNEKYVPFLPSTNCIANKGLLKNYLSSVSAFRLLTLIGKKDKYVNSKSISVLIQDIDYKSTDIYKNLGALT